MTPFQELEKLESITTWEEYRPAWETLLNRWEETKAFFSKMTIKQLNQYTYHRGKKVTMVSIVVDQFYNGAIPNDGDMATKQYGSVFNFNENTDRDWHIDNFKSFTKEKFQKYLAFRNKREQQFTNPITLNDYRTKKMHKGLSLPEYMVYGKLFALECVERNLAKKYKGKTYESLENVRLVEAYHERKEIPLYVVQLTERVETSEFRELRTRAKQLGGYYSSYAKGQAKPGFQFERVEDAQTFMSDFDTNDIMEEQRALAEQTKVERLLELANRWEQNGQDSLNQDRLDNTARRARMAAHAEDEAIALINRANTIRSIAESIGDGQAGALRGVTYATDIETLFSVRFSAYYRWRQKQSLEDREKPATISDFFKYIQFPTAKLPSDLIRNWALEHSNKKGCKLAMGRLLKASNLADMTNIESYTKELNKLKPHLDKWDRERIEDAFTHSVRCKRMGLESSLAVAGALIELENHIQQFQSPAFLKEREINRRFRGKKISGFFPTPDAVISTMLEIIDFPDGCTILEPSAGLGHIARFLSNPDCFEYNYDLNQALQEKGFNVIGRDFLGEHERTWDRIVMNPPFENRQDEVHVHHAFTRLNTKGALIAVVANNKKGSDFEEWVWEQGGSFRELPENSFRTAFNPTGVSTCLVYITK